MKENAMNERTTIIVHTVHNERTLCGKYAPKQRTCTGDELKRLDTWMSCPLCTLADTCHTLDTFHADSTRIPNETPHVCARNPNENTASARQQAVWIQPPLFP